MSFCLLFSFYFNFFCTVGMTKTGEGNVMFFSYLVSFSFSLLFTFTLMTSLMIYLNNIFMDVFLHV